MIGHLEQEHGMDDPFDCTIAFDQRRSSPANPATPDLGMRKSRNIAFDQRRSSPAKPATPELGIRKSRNTLLDCHPTSRIEATRKTVDLWLVSGRAWEVAARVCWSEMLHTALKVGEEYSYKLIECDRSHEKISTAHIAEDVLEMMHFRMAEVRADVLYRTISKDNKSYDVGQSLTWGFMTPILEGLLTEILIEYNLILVCADMAFGMDIDYTNRMEEFMH